MKILLLITLLLFNQSIKSQPYQQWVYHYPDANCYSIAIDKQNNVCLVGYVLTANGSDIVTIKCSSDGALIWQKAYGGIGYNSGNSIAIDDSNNIYVAGNIGSGFCVVIKYNPVGQVKWIADYHGPAQLASVSSVVTDHSGNIYI